MENLEQESIEAEADFQDAKKLQSQRLMKSVPAKSFQVKGSTASTKNEPVIDSMGFPVELSSDHLSSALSWESDFSSSNPFAANGARCVSSPVSVTSSLETPSCAWCGTGQRCGSRRRRPWQPRRRRVWRSWRWFPTCRRSRSRPSFSAAERARSPRRGSPHAPRRDRRKT